ncbi:MAG: hypothetical protein ACE5K0_00545 [Candidatus Methanofastidiosia archaeon]
MLKLVGIGLLLVGILVYISATDYISEEFVLEGEEVVLDYEFSRLDPMAHRLSGEIESEREITISLSGSKAFEKRGKRIKIDESFSKGERIVLKLSNSTPTKVRYDLKLVCYSYIYSGSLFTFLGAILLLLGFFFERKA